MGWLKPKGGLPNLFLPRAASSCPTTVASPPWQLGSSKGGAHTAAEPTAPEPPLQAAPTHTSRVGELLPCWLVKLQDERSHGVGAPLPAAVTPSLFGGNQGGASRRMGGLMQWDTTPTGVN